MYQRIILGVFFSIFIFEYICTANIVLLLPDSGKILTLDSYKENEKLYIHLPSLIMKINGTINVKDNVIQILNGNKNINIDLQSNIASVNEISSTKLIQLQNQVKLWEDTIWIEINDAKVLVKYLTGENLNIKSDTIDETRNVENKTNIPNQELKENPGTNTEDLHNLGEEVLEKKLLEEIKPIQDNISISTQRNQNSFTLNSIFIDPGHGGEDNGITFPSGKFEKEITLLFAMNLKEKMKTSNIDVIMSREDDKTKSIKERCREIIDKKVNFFISIHTGMPTRERENINIFNPKILNDNINIKTNHLVDGIVKNIKEKYKNTEIKKIVSPLILNDYTNIPGIILEISPQYKEDLKEEKWDTFLDKKSEIYTIITEAIIKVKNMKEETIHNE